MTVTEYSSKTNYQADEFNDVPKKKEANKAEEKSTKQSGSHTMLKRLFCTVLQSVNIVTLLLLNQSDIITSE